jgi:hypothetical protein
VSSAAGLSLDAQPAALTDSVSRNGFDSGMETLYRGEKKIFHHGDTETREKQNLGEKDTEKDFLCVSVVKSFYFTVTSVI